MITANAGSMTTAFYSRWAARYSLIAPNVFTSWQMGEMDIFALRKGSLFVDEIEIKCSTSDFKADFKKSIHAGPSCRRKKHLVLAEGTHLANYFSFLVPEALVEKIVIPDHAGLYAFTAAGRIVTKKKAPRLHTRRLDVKKALEISQKMAWRYWTIRHYASAARAEENRLQQYA